MSKTTNQMIDIAAIEALSAQMKALPPKPQTKFAPKEAVARIAADVVALLDRGYSIGDVHEMVTKAYDLKITEGTLQSYLRSAMKTVANDGGSKVSAKRSRKRKPAIPDAPSEFLPAPAQDAEQTAEPMPDVADPALSEDAMDMQPETADASPAADMTTDDTDTDADTDGLNRRLDEMMNTEDDASVADVTAETAGPVEGDTPHATSDAEDL